MVERDTLLDFEPPELPEDAKDEATINVAAGLVYQHHERLAALDREFAINEYQVRSLKRQLSEVAA